MAPTPVVMQSGDGRVFKFDTDTEAQAFETSAVDAGGSVVRLEPALPPKTLFELESDLEALEETLEMVTPDQEQAFLADFSATLQAAQDKRDRVHWFMCFLEAAIAADDAEKKRIDKRTARMQAALDRLDNYVTVVIKSLGRDAKDKWRKLEGSAVTLQLKNNPPSVAIVDEAAVPAECKTVSVTLPALLWEETCDSLDLDLRERVLDSVKKPNSMVVKALVKDAIAQAVPDWKEQLKTNPAVFCESVPGASIAAGGTRLVRE